jgi:hypothetical protein
MRTAQTWWDTWTTQIAPPATTDLVLAGRSEAVEALRKRLTASPRTTTVSGASVEEVLAFLSAMAVEADLEGDGQTLARMVFVDDPAAWRSLVERKSPLILVPADAGLASEVPADCTHQILVPIRSDQDGDITVPAIDASGASGALQNAGMNEQEAGDCGHLARRSLTALRRRLAVTPALHLPKWASSPVPRALRGVLLAGTWSDVNEGDHAILAMLIGETYEALRENLAELARDDDPFVARVGNKWHVVAPYDAWLLLRSHIRADDLERLQDAVAWVLGEVDPALALPQEDRWKARIEGKVRVYSGSLREGLAKTLALLGSHGDALAAPYGASGSEWASFLVRKLIEQAVEDRSLRRWFSLADLLPLLAEAGPEPFIDAVRAGVSEPDSQLRGMFVDPDRAGVFSSASPHTGLLWALENLAWSADHFGAAVDLLARLDALDPDPDSRHRNRPFASLESIFCTWHPDNSVSPERRLAVLDGLRSRHRDCSWRLMISMLPEFHGIHMPTHDPKFRDWKRPRYPVTNLEYFSVVSEVLTRLIEDVNASAERWCDLLGRLPELPPAERERLTNALEVTTAITLTEEVSDALWQAIHDLVIRHREFADADWTLPDDDIARLESLARNLRPVSAYATSRWLFKEHMPSLGDVSKRDDFQAWEQAVNDQRRDAVSAIDKEGGLELIKRLAGEAAVPWAVGIGLSGAVAGKYVTQLVSLLGSSDRAMLELASAYFTRQFACDGWPWLSGLLERGDLSPLERARLLLATRDFPSAWEEADAQGERVASEFWNNFPTFGLGHDFAFAEIVGTRMMGVGRFAAALDFLHLYARQDGQDEGTFADLVADGLEGLLPTMTEDTELRMLSGYDYEQLFALLDRNRDRVGHERLAGLEWAYLPVLGSRPAVPALSELMAADPAFFVEVVSSIYGRHSGEGNEEPPLEVDEQRRARATNAYHLLSSWRRPPGLSGDSLDGEELRRWLETATPLLVEADRYEVGMVHFGQVLVASPADDGGEWPPATIRDLFEELQDDSVESGFRTEIINRRGVTTRGLEDGGQQERSLVSGYRADADRFTDRWPRTAAIFRSLATSFEAEARRNDESAERFRRGLSD